MASIIIRNLEEGVKTRLRVRAAENGRSMEAEARVILRRAVGRRPSQGEGLGSALAALFTPLGGVELDIPPREPMREPLRFD
ncbi:MAG: plasmid stabilization protein [Gammaproteobacteria bacterium]|nr:plasmid stabilization protein [Gammaproteobacteria bacterium]MXW08860.1 plasmid stabilization protein [Gammaproteobacteria bacterium]MXY29697.1 plasmid stabilization protein [Gammaproteobacteria bacterium]MYC51878.1 plasmid stabilization protein [Gammaproteobacteria bacterium]MYC98483.1 plasmid stabilization protein [Gammaproteobacteria bacterium]